MVRLSCLRKTAFISVLFFVGLNCFASEVDVYEYGNKYKNLVRLQTILNDDPTVQVPPFFGVSTDRIKKQILKQYPSLLADYEFALKKLVPESRSAFVSENEKGFFNKLVEAVFPIKSIFSDQSAEQALSSIAKNIKETYNDGQFFTANETEFLFAPIVENFVTVRSTGIEDGQTVANAGGNKTLPLVYPYVGHVYVGISNVVASYFGMQSLKNRIAGGEDIINTPLCIPAIVQRAIYETFNHSELNHIIPISGVAYSTNQTLSGISFAVTEINAAFGHGEGVVSNKVVADRYYVMPSRAQNGQLQIYSKIYNKKERLAPDALYELQVTPNSKELQNKSTLTQDQVKRLNVTLKKIEAAYGQPMDVEFVIYDSIIYIVQARPAMKHEAHPSYCQLDQLNQDHMSDPVSSIALVPGGSQLLIIEDAKDLLVTKTLDEADQAPNNSSVKAVLVKEWASSLSHAAVNFISHGIACLYLPSFGEFKKIEKEISAATPLVIDIQRGLVFVWKGSRQELARAIKQGWFEHPIEGSLTVMQDAMQLVKAPNAPLPQDPVLIKLLDAFKSTTQREQQKELLQKIVVNVESRISLTQKRIHSLGTSVNQQLKNGFDAFVLAFNNLTAEINGALAQNADHFEMLFYHKMLMALLYQEPDAQNLVNGYNYNYFLTQFLAQQTIMGLLRRVGNDFKLSKQMALAAHLPSSDLVPAWKELLTFMQEMSSQDSAFEKEVDEFSSMLYALESKNRLPLWFATEFYQTSNEFNKHESHNKISYVKSMVQNARKVYAFDQAVEKQLEEINNTIQKISTQAKSGFSSVAHVKQVWQQARAGIINPLIADDFAANYAQASKTQKMIALSTMRAAVDVIDMTLKNLKTSAAITKEDRLTEFKSMLADFYQLFKAWITKITPPNIIAYNSQWSLERYMQCMQQLYNVIVLGHRVTDNLYYDLYYYSYDATDEAFFIHSPKFAVDAAKIGSGTAFERHYPQSGEDIFMLIHQNSLMAISGAMQALFKDNSIDEQLYLPPLMAKVVTYFEQFKNKNVYNRESYELRCERIGIDYTDQDIIIYYNMPLSNHSATFQIRYNKSSQQIFFSTQFLGEARERWEQIALLATMAPELSGLTLAEDVDFDQSRGKVAWNWIVNSENQCKQIELYLIFMAKLSYQLIRNNIDEIRREIYQGNQFKQDCLRALKVAEQQFGTTVTYTLLSQLDLLEN